MIDKLDKIFGLQEHLNKSIIEKRHLNYDTNDWLRQWCLAVFSETNEVLDEISWKHWKNRKPIFIPNVKEEIVDLFHFIVCMALEVGMTPDELFERYVAKNEENHNRQDGLVAGREDYKVED